MFYQFSKEGFCMEYKRHKPSAKNKTGNGGSVGTAVFVILTIVLIAAILVLSPIGNYLSEHLIDPFFSCGGKSSDDKEIVSALKQHELSTPVSTSKPTPDVKKQQTITIEETPFYILQMGAFASSEAANQRAEEIRRLGAGGVVFQDSKAYRVFAAAYLNEESLVKVQSQVRSDGFEATPFITGGAALKLMLEGDTKAVDTVKDAVGLLDRIPLDLSQLCLSYDKTEIGSADVLKKLYDYKTLCQTSIESLNSIQNEDIGTIRDQIGKYLENISTFLQEHDTINTDQLSGALKTLQLQCIADYILFFERK